MVDLLEIRMPVRIEPITKQLPDAAVAEFTRRKADAMDDDQADIASIRAVVEVGGRDLEGSNKTVLNYLHCFGERFKAKGQGSRC